MVCRIPGKRGADEDTSIKTRGVADTGKRRKLQSAGFSPASDLPPMRAAKHRVAGFEAGANRAGRGTVPAMSRDIGQDSLGHVEPPPSVAAGNANRSFRREWRPRIAAAHRARDSLPRPEDRSAADNPRTDDP